MNETWRKRWCDALESGEYAQITGRLRSPTGYCCLGIAEELRLVEEGKTWVLDDGDFLTPTTGWTSDKEAVVMSDETVALFGLANSNPTVPFEKVVEILGEERVGDLGIIKADDAGLAGLNDAGVTFGEITSLIRAAL